jgi:hypothetical protein
MDTAGFTAMRAYIRWTAGREAPADHARPALDITAFRNDDRFIVLTHGPGSASASSTARAGQIVRSTATARKRLLNADPPHGIRIVGFIHDGSEARSRSIRAGCRMQHLNVYD